jgi:hypothetical protein
MSDAAGPGTYVVKLACDYAPTQPRWVIAQYGRDRLGARESAKVFPSRIAAEAEAALLRELPSSAKFSVVVESD